MPPCYRRHDGEMARIVYDAAMSVNGFLADADHSLEWLFAVPDAEAAAIDLPDARVLVMGANTFRWVVAQIGAEAEPARWSEHHGDIPTFVFARSAVPMLPGANIRLVSGEVSAVLPDILAAAAGGTVWLMGGGELAGQFVDADALDEIALTIAPAFLDSGASLLPRRIESDRLTLTQVEQRGQFARVRYQVRPMRHVSQN